MFLGDGVAFAVLWPCESDTECTADGAICEPETSLCECPGFDTVFSEDYSKCLSTAQLGDACQDSVQCNLMPTGASCKTGVCDCADGQTYLRGKCRPLNGLNEPCETVGLIAPLSCYSQIKYVFSSAGFGLLLWLRSRVR